MAYRNAPISLLMRLVYAFFRLLTWVGVGVFYRRRLVVSRNNAYFDGPAIVISNHPSTLMDPLNTGLSIRQEMFFLANYGLFKHPLSNWVFRRLFCIPVKRKEDVAEGEARDNDAAFEASFQHLEKNGVLYIAAEGVSWMNRYVRPFKTGAARIAFGAERRNDWNLGVKIVPVGLSYDAPRLFRSRVTVEYGPAIDPAPWAKAYAENPEKAVDDFTAELEERVRALILDAGNEAGDALVERLEIMIRNTRIGLSDKEKYALLKDFLTKNRSNEAFTSKVDQYFSMLETHGLTDAGVCEQSETPEIQRSMATKRWISLLLLPFALLGYLCWFLPCWLPWLLCKRLNLYPGYDSNVKMLAGLFSFPLALWGAWALVFWTSHSPGLAWIALPLLIGCGYVSEYCLDIAQGWKEGIKAQKYKESKAAHWGQIKALRHEIMHTMGPVS